jgi:predicted TIM-barrel fold metal-dependent hydrolase
MDQPIMQNIRELISFLELNRDSLVIDACTHAADTDCLHESFRDNYESIPGYYHGRPVSAEDLLREMELASVSMCLLCPDPAVIHYSGDPDANFESLLKANRYVYESAMRYPERFIPAGWTDPAVVGMDNALKLVHICVNDFGFLVIRLHQAGNFFPTGMETVRIMMDHIIGMGAVPAVHSGAGTLFSNVEQLTELASRYRGHELILLHMAEGSAGHEYCDDYYSLTRDMGLQYPDLKFVLSMQRAAYMENDLISYQLAGWPFSGNLFCASGAPLGRMTWNFGGFRWMLLSLMDADHHTDERIRHNPGLFDEEVMRNYLGGNFTRFLIAGYKNLLKNHESRDRFS